MSKQAETKIVECFVIMPFSDSGNDRNEEYWSNFFEKFLKNPIENKSFSVPSNYNDSSVQVKFKVFRHERSSGPTISEIIPKIIDTELILVVLTDLKPNVIYELGIRHALKHGTILAIKKSVIKSFKEKFTNLSAYTLLEYEDYDSEDFIKQFEGIVNKGLPVKLWQDSEVVNYSNSRKRQDAEKKPIFDKLTSKFSDLKIKQIELEILWLDNYSETIAPIIAFLLKKGANVTFSVNTPHFEYYLKTKKFDVIISDMREGDDEDEGITNYINFLQGQLHINKDVPYIIFAGEYSMSKYSKKALKSGIEEENLISEVTDLVQRLINISNKVT